MSRPSSGSHQDESVGFFRTLSKSKVETSPALIATPDYRRRVGLFLGVVIALMYGFTSQAINKLDLPTIPVAQPPFGLIGNLLILVVSGAAIGLVCALPKSSSDGVVRASAVSVVVIIIHWLLTNPVLSGGSQLTFTNMLGLFGLFITTIPAMMLLRLAIDNQTDTLEKPVWAWERIRVPLGILALVGVAGAFSVFPAHVQMAFKDLQALIQSGLTVSRSADLPPALREKNGVSNFLDFAAEDYTLEQSSSFELLADLSLDDERGNAILIARFPRGAIVACAYSPLGERLRCKSYVSAKFFQSVGSLDRVAGHVN